MNITYLKEKWIKLVSDMNKKGIPLPSVRDPKTGKGSVSLTLVFISFNMVLLGLIGKASGFFGGIDIAQALNLFYACSALYWGRQFQAGNSSIGDVEKSKAVIPEKTPAAPVKSIQPVRVDDPDQA